MMVAACLGLLTKAQTVIPSYVPTNGLVGWWPFNGNANDLSVNANNGTVNGATLTADRYGNSNKAYSFSLGNYITIPQSSIIDNTNNSTINIWFKTNLTTSTQLFKKGGYSPNSNGEQISIQLNYPNTGYDVKYNSNCIPGNNWVSCITNSSVVNDNTWHMLTCSTSSINLKLYIDGVLKNTTVAPNTQYDICMSEINIGRNWINDNDYYIGQIDDIGFWSRPLTECEIKKLYTSGSFSVSSSASNTICVGQSLNLTAAGATTYNWSTGATSQSISVSPTVSTVYTVSTTYSAGCTDSRTFSVTVNACTGLNEAESVINNVRVFPNPAKEQLNITVNNNAVMGKKYSITNTLGQEVANGIFTKQTTELNIQQLSAGLYQLNIEGLNENYKFIKE